MAKTLPLDDRTNSIVFPKEDGILRLVYSLKVYVHYKPLGDGSAEVFLLKAEPFGVVSYDLCFLLRFLEDLSVIFDESSSSDYSSIT